MSVESELLELIKKEPFVMIAEMMDDEMKKTVLQHEMARLEELVPFINEGMEEAFKEEKAIVIVMDNNIKNKIDEEGVDYSNSSDTKTDSSSFTLRTDSGKIIGEAIYDEEELEELRDDPTVYFLSENFVTYNNVATPGEKQFFVMSSAGSNFFTGQDLESLVTSLTVAIPSTNTDHYIKDVYDLAHDESIGTLILGFTE